jgi:hypothetical protein
MGGNADSSTRVSGGVRRVLIAATLAASTLLFAASSASAATVAKFAFNPSPIGMRTSVAPGSTVAVTLTAENSTGAPVAGGSVWLAFSQAAGGGSASVGLVSLALKPHMFTADSSGHIAITYIAPATFPNTGCDYVTAQNRATHATSPGLAYDPLCFSPITALSFAPKPIARIGALLAHTSVSVTLTVLGPGSAPLAGGIVYMNFKPAAGSNATATVGGIALTTTFTAETADGGGHIVVTYTTSDPLPLSGFDRMSATSDPRFGAVTTSDAYKY